MRLALTAVMVTLVVAGGGLSAQPHATPNSQPNPYRPIENYFKLPPGRASFGAVPAIEIDRDGTSLWVLTRCFENSCVGRDEAPILKFDAAGRLVTSFGAGMFNFPHGLFADPDGNLWVSDAQGPDGKNPASRGKGHQVFKFSPEGRVLMTLGKAGVAGEGPDTLNEPTDIVVGRTGEIFVSAGHGFKTNARIVKYSKEGTFMKAWGRVGSGPGEFSSPHALAIDSQGRIFVGDRGNSRIQIFDQDGRLLDQWTQFSRTSGLHIDRRDVLYASDTQSNEKTNPGWQRGVRIGSARDGTVTAFIPDPRASTTGEGVESVAADANGIVYAGLNDGATVIKFVKK
jgi:sugar lactone lactonase YvrE